MSIEDIKDLEYQKFIDTPDGPAVRSMNYDNLVNVEYDSFDITYYTSGNGDGEIESIIYKLSGSTVLTITMTYNSLGKVSNVSRI